jgi:hypothetical protein
MEKIKIGNWEFNYIVDDSVPPGTVIFQDPKTNREIGRITNIERKERRMKPKFKTGDKVTSVLNPDFLGQVTSIISGDSGSLYCVSYFKDGELLSASMLGFELEPASENGGVGFGKK